MDAKSPAQSASPGRASEADLYHERQARKRGPKPKGKESFHLVDGGKVVKKTVSPSGNEYSVYIGTRKECDKAGIVYQK